MEDPAACLQDGFAGGRDMTSRQTFFQALIFILVLTSAVFLWQAIAVPRFSEKEREIRNENAALVKDINEIEAMNGSAAELEDRISVVEKGISQKYSGRSETVKTVSDIITRVQNETRLDHMQTKVGEGRMISPPGVFIPALYTAEITILFEGTEAVGPAFIRGLEKSMTADFEITAFVYRAPMDEPDFEEGTDEEAKEAETEENEEELAASEVKTSGEWLITALIYYYDKE
jgi:hypothetical protein